MTEESAFLEISELQKELEEISAKKNCPLPSERIDEIRNRLDVLMESLNPLLTDKEVEGLDAKRRHSARLRAQKSGRYPPMNS